MTNDRDVSEALKTLETLSAHTTGTANRAKDAADTIRSEIRDLRERLEEVREERDAAQKAAEVRLEEREEMWEAANTNLRVAHRARRQRDELVEAVREAENELRVWPGEQLTVGHVQAARDRLSEALEPPEGEQQTLHDWTAERDKVICGDCGAVMICGPEGAGERPVCGRCDSGNVAVASADALDGSEGEDCTCLGEWDGPPPEPIAHPDCPVHGTDADEVGEVDDG